MHVCTDLWPVAAAGRRPRGPNNLASAPASYRTCCTVPDGTAPSICNIALSLSCTTGCACMQYSASA